MLIRCKLLCKLLGAACLLSACQSPPKAPEVGPKQIAKNTGFWYPYLLYTHSQRYKKLLVEVDAVTGTEPTDEQLAELKAFLEKNCDKPGGIEVLRDSTIPPEEARDRDRHSLARRWMRGPPDDETAFMYFLFYTSKVTGGKKKNPIALMLPYPSAVLIDQRYGPPQVGPTKRANNVFMLHEAAHLLGMTRNTHHSDGIHCKIDGCVNNAKTISSIPRALLLQDAIRQRGFCADCQRDFLVLKKTPPDDNLEFFGPYVLRDEGEYQVLTLPGFVFINAGLKKELSLAELEEKRAASLVDDRTDKIGLYITGYKEQVLRVLPLLEKDPYEFIRTHHKKIKIPGLNNE